MADPSATNDGENNSNATTTSTAAATTTSPATPSVPQGTTGTLAQGPDQNRAGWFGCLIGDYQLPTNPATGSVVVKPSSKQKIDHKGAAGKNKGKSTKQGTEPTKIEIDWEFTAADWKDQDNDTVGVQTVLIYMDPNGSRKGGPFAFSHPDSDWRGVTAIMIAEVDAVVWKGHHGTCKIKAEEWTADDAKNKGAGGSATTTPTTDTKGNPTGKNSASASTSSMPTGAEAGTNAPTAAEVPYNAATAPNASP